MNLFRRMILPGCARLGQHYSPKPLISFKPRRSGFDEKEFPHISIVIPSYNQGEFIEKTLLSLKNQHYPKLEIIVIDGGSSDNTLTIIKKYENLLSFWVSEPDNGQADAINKGFKRSTGAILAWLNSDDLLMPNALFKVAHQFIHKKYVDVVYGHRVLCDEHGQDIGKWIIAKQTEFTLSYADMLPQETMFWRRSLWDKVNANVDGSFQFALDWDLIMKFVRAEATFMLLPSFLGVFRLHQNQKTQSAIETIGFYEMQRVRDLHLSFKGIDKARVIYVQFQKLSFIIFLLKSRLKELCWKVGFIKID